MQRVGYSNGHKIWSGVAQWAGLINVFVKELDIQGNLKGITAFVVRQGTPGLRQGAEALTLGMRGMIQE
jgi:alkylation response protein AidB-like acyl-CoA dehydrogenase